MKKLISLLLALCMLLGVSAALAEDKIELTAFQYALENQNTDFNGLWFFDELEKTTNTHVTFQMVKDAAVELKNRKTFENNRELLEKMTEELMKSQTRQMMAEESENGK